MRFVIYTVMLIIGIISNLMITNKQQKNYLIPVIDQVVIDTDIQNRKLLIRPMKGIFEDED